MSIMLSNIAHSIVVIVVGNGPDELSSNIREGCLGFTSY